MSALAELEVAVRARRAVDRIDAAYLHRAVREDDFGITRGRDAIRAAALAEGATDTVIVHDLGGMIVFETTGWRGHRWAEYDGGRIVRDTLIVDGAARARALGQGPADAARLGAGSPVHAPLGELRSGQGQCGVSANALLPHDFPAAVRPFAEAMHRAWNGRAFGGISPRGWRGPDGHGGGADDYADWLAGLLATMPDAVLLFERGISAGDRVAIRFRLHGHRRDGDGLVHRVRAIGSSVLTLAAGAVVAEDVLLDTLAIAVTGACPLIDYTA